MRREFQIDIFCLGAEFPAEQASTYDGGQRPYLISGFHSRRVWPIRSVKNAMRRIINTGAILLVIASWLALCKIGLTSPTFVRGPLSIAIRNLKNTNLKFDAVETWNAVSPVSEFTKTMSDQIILFSTLMFVGFIVFAIGRKKQESPNKTVLDNRLHAPSSNDPRIDNP